jgi:predicted NodU family carbamoyl transferase
MVNDKNALLLSLGHNSSAIFTDGARVIGYEQERLDRIKSSSASPMGAITEIDSFLTIKRETPIFVTHWFDWFSKDLPDNKYTRDISQWADTNNSQIYSHNEYFTHHDAHAWSALSFYTHYKDKTYDTLTKEERMIQDINYRYYLVVDGFGNNQEVLSLYHDTVDGKDLNLTLRAYGYKNSLGLMYQYATDYCGMKMNQDEYKFLGYESQITNRITPQQKEFLDAFSSEEAGRLFIEWRRCSTPPGTADEYELINMKDLEDTKEYWRSVYAKVINTLEIFDRRCDLSRIVIGYFIQEVLEKSLIKLVKSQGIQNLILSGGVFYNVKVNHALLKSIKGIFSVVPVAGDQGASIGFYEKFVGHFNWDTLCIGDRNMNDFDQLKHLPRVSMAYSEDQLYETLSSKIRAGQICNLITPKMEYGPRALGATSSLFLPTEYNSSFNNRLNKRNEVMPFAPMIPAEAMPLVFEKDYRRVVGSDRFMILTYDYVKPVNEYVRGVYHVYPYNTGTFSGRPEVIDYPNNKPIHNVLTDLWRLEDQMLLTNTSYNYHGEPIVYSAQDVKQTHLRQLDNKKTLASQVPEVNLIIYNVKSNDD